MSRAASPPSGAKGLDPYARTMHGRRGAEAVFRNIVMRLKTFVAMLLGILLAGALAAQGIQMPPPTPAPDPENTLLLDLSTGGRVAIQLRPDVAPKTVERIKVLTRRGFYNGLAFHRVIDGFMAQTGDPKGDGTGGSDLPNLAAEFNGLPHVRGAVAAARTEDENSANSQFYIMFSPKLPLDGRYTVFGRVMSGMAYVDALNRGEPPAQPSVIVQASIAADNVPPPSAEKIAAAQNRAATRSALPAGGHAAGPAQPPPPSIKLPDPPKPRPKKAD
jgi:peptidylprolyl isomerase